MNEKSHRRLRGQRTFSPGTVVPNSLKGLEGDLNEYFIRNVAEKGVFYARLVYIIDVIKFLRAYTVQKPSPIQPGALAFLAKDLRACCLSHFFKTKLATMISLISLALEVIMLYHYFPHVSYELGFNRHYRNYDRVGRVSLSMIDEKTKQESNLVWSNPQLPEELRELYPEIEAVTGLLKLNGKVVVKTGNSIFLEENFFTTDQNYSTVFNHEWTAGNFATALRDPGCIVISEYVASRCFGTSEAINKILSVNDARLQSNWRNQGCSFRYRSAASALLST